MSPRPDWVNEYIEFHRSSVESDGDDGYRVKQGVPFLVYECTGENKCGGIGDRINSMVLVLYLAMCSGRVLLINSPYPSPLQNFLEPNQIHWDALPPMDVELPTLDIMDARNNDLLVDASTIGYKLGRCNGMPARHTLRSIFANQCRVTTFRRHAKRSSRTLAKFPKSRSFVGPSILSSSSAMPFCLEQMSSKGVPDCQLVRRTTAFTYEQEMFLWA